MFSLTRTRFLLIGVREDWILTKHEIERYLSSVYIDVLPWGIIFTAVWFCSKTFVLWCRIARLHSDLQHVAKNLTACNQARLVAIPEGSIRVIQLLHIKLACWWTLGICLRSALRISDYGWVGTYACWINLHLLRLGPPFHVYVTC